MFILLLKILGCVLLVTIGLMLLSLSLLLFVPVRYTARAGTNGAAGIDVKASWFLKIMRLRYTRTLDEDDLQGWVLWFRLPIGETETANAAESETETASINTSVPKAESTSTPAHTSDTSSYGQEHAKTESPKRASHIEEPTPSITHGDDRESDEAAPGILSRIKEMINKVNYYKNYPNRNEIISATWILLKQLGKAIKPKKIDIEGEIGFDSPQYTGYLFAALGIVTRRAQTGIKPNFDEKALYLRTNIKGRMNLWSILWPLFRYCIKRPIWPITKKILFKKGDANE